MRQYLDLMRQILETGVEQMDRTETGTLTHFGAQMRFDLADGFPLLTTKKLHLRSIIVELLWFLRGDTNIAWLKANKVSIWDEWAKHNSLSRRYLLELTANRSDDEQLRLSLADALNPAKSLPEFLRELLWYKKGRHNFKSIGSEKWDEHGLDLGPVYGKQWRHWETADGREIDQIAVLIDLIKRDPGSRRQVVTAWNPGELDRMALAPCHCLFQTQVAGGRLNLQLYQRSADFFLGVPFNIASYALLTHMLARECGLQPGVFVWTGGDCHLYSNHLEQARLQLAREPRPLPQLVLKDRGQPIDGYEPGDFAFEGYDPHPHIAAPVAI